MSLLENIRSGTWQELQQEAMLIRKLVFVQEQNIPQEDEWDEHDATSIHFILYQADQAIATARLLDNNSIGRVAVLLNYRGQGIGQRLMQYIIDYAKLKQRPYVELSAQVYAIGFYESLGFKKTGDIYDDCGIPHIHMILNY